MPWRKRKLKGVKEHWGGKWGGQGAGLPFSHTRQSGDGRAIRTSGRDAKAGAVLDISVGRRGSEREQVSEQLVC